MKLVKIVEIGQDWGKLHRSGPVKWNCSKLVKLVKISENGSEHIFKIGEIGQN